MVKGHANIRDVAQRAGVSIASVSRALQKPLSTKVSPKLRQRILDICAEMHYEPNAHTKRMFSRRSDTVAILFPPSAAVNHDAPTASIVDLNLSSSILGAQARLAQQGVGLLLNELNDSYLANQEYLRIVRSRAVDGVLVWGVRENLNWFPELQAEGIPIVMLQTFLAKHPCPHVIVDDRQGMIALVEKVLAYGHRKIALTPAPETSSAGRIRNQAVRDALAQHQLELFCTYPEMGYGYEVGCRSAEYILAHAPETTCIINSNDMAAWGAIDTLRRRGIAVPQDISVVGCDGLAFPGDTRISSYYLPSYEIGQLGAELLLKLIAGENVPLETILPVELVAGNTLQAVK